MDINLPLILFVAVVGSGIVCLIDFLVFKRKRDMAIAALEAKYPSLTEAQKQQDASYQQGLINARAEPAIVEYSKSFFPVLLLVFVLRSFLIEPFQIPSESMVPTLEVGDFILVNKFSYGIRLPLANTKIVPVSDPKRGDVMVFFPPHDNRYFIKRVIGLPGDTVRVSNSAVYVNGEKLEQNKSYIDERSDRECARILGKYQVSEEMVGDETHLVRNCVSDLRAGEDRVWEVPAGHYFMMGDNRDNSSDSRVWGPVPDQRIVGKAFAIWMHWDSFLSIPSFHRVGKL